MMDQTTKPAACGSIMGVALIAIGCILLMDRLDIVEFRELLRFWPVTLIALGMHQLFEWSREGQDGR